MKQRYLTKPQFKIELEKCLQCKTKPCEKACPVHCSPHDFIAAAKVDNIADAAGIIAEQNPLGEVCGLICPDKFCMRVCVRANLDAPIRIPQVQAEIMRQTRENKLFTPLPNVAANGKKIAVIGLGPSGIGAVAELIKHGFSVTVYERASDVGGALNLIPQMRLPREIVAYEWQKLAQSPLVKTHFATKITDFTALSNEFDAVIVTVGEQKSRTLGVEGENLAADYTQYLQNPAQFATNGHIAIVGGGAAAVDCATTAAEQGATHVEMFVRRRLSDMRITDAERKLLLEKQVDITTMTRPVKLEKTGDTLTIYTRKTQFDNEGKLVDVPNTETARGGFAHIILALGSTRAEDLLSVPNIFYAGDVISGSSTAVEAIASGKSTARKAAQKFGFKV